VPPRHRLVIAALPPPLLFVQGATVTMDIALQYTLPRDPTTLCNLVYAYG